MNHPKSTPDYGGRPGGIIYADCEGPGTGNRRAQMTDAAQPKTLFWCALAAISTFLVKPANASNSSNSGLLNQYCIGCHNQKLKTAGVSLEGLDPANVGDHAGVWERALRKVRSGQMPPPGLPHADAAARTWPRNCPARLWMRRTVRVHRLRRRTIPIVWQRPTAPLHISGRFRV